MRYMYIYIYIYYICVFLFLFSMVQCISLRTGRPETIHESLTLYQRLIYTADIKDLEQNSTVNKPFLHVNTTNIKHIPDKVGKHIKPGS